MAKDLRLTRLNLSKFQGQCGTIRLVMLSKILISLLFFSVQAWAQVGQRIDLFSSQYLGARYSHQGPLGEEAKPDLDPLIRLDQFDCTTYVETMLALSRANNPADIHGEVKDILTQIRYANGVPRYEERNHFPSLDWIAENTRKGFLRDVTFDLSDSAKVLVTPINKGAWMLLQSRKDPLGFANVNLPEDRESLAELPVISIRKVLLEVNNVSFLEEGILSRIKTGTIVNVVPFKRDLTATIGTHLDINHQAFLIWKGSTLFIRHASSGSDFVSELPLLEYLMKRKSSIEYLNFLEPL